MPANTAPIFTLVPEVVSTKIPTANAQVRSDGVTAGTGADIVYLAFAAGADGSFVDRVRFQPVAAAAAVNTIATTLRAYLSTVAAPGATTAVNTNLLGEVSVPIVAAANSINATSWYELAVGFPIPAGTYIHVSQHVAQTANAFWQATVIGGDY